MSDVSRRNAARTIASLNDEFRQSFVGGSVLMTAGIRALGPEFVAKTLSGVRSFSTFAPENDPYREHDFGLMTIDGQKLFWKIDCYDPSMEYGSEDPSNPKVTRRVLTIMLAKEY
jgi:uncharacterized protein DUF3768